MKKNIISILLLLFPLANLIAQNNLKKADDLGRLSICALVELDQNKFSSESQEFLKEKLNQIVVSRSMGGVYGFTRFVLTASMQYTSKYILPGTPIRHSYEILVTFYLGDGVEGKIFSTTNITLSGIGNSETKALKEALNKINPSNILFDDLIYKGKDKMVEYYNSICDAEIRDAERLAGEDNISLALFKLSQIPDVARDCFNKSREVSIRLYKKYKERECASLINSANNIWHSNPSPEGGRQVAQILNGIDPETTCFKSAKSLVDKINSEIKGSNIELERFNRAYQLAEQKNSSDLEKLRVNAIKDMVTSYYNSQPSTIIYYKSYNITPWYYY